MQLTGTLSNNGYVRKRNNTNNDSNKKVISDSGLFTAGAKALSSNTEAGPSTAAKGKGHTIDMIPMLSVGKGKDYLSQMPDEILSQIFSLLDLKSLLPLFQVNKRFDNLNFMHYLRSIPTEGLALGSNSRKDLIIYIKDRFKQEGLKLLKYLYVMENPNEVIKNTKYEEVVGVAPTSLLDKKKTREVILLQFLQADFYKWALEKGITLPDFQAILDEVGLKDMDSTGINMSTELKLESLAMSFALIKQVKELKNSFKKVIIVDKLVNTTYKALDCFVYTVGTLVLLVAIASLFILLKVGGNIQLKLLMTLDPIFTALIISLIISSICNCLMHLLIIEHKSSRIFNA